uniref:Uncharacterized protein n=1 Tax=Anguilla anguilla TaxID=7936 RepID=A0A0E9WRZ7_ANGAN
MSLVHLLQHKREWISQGRGVECVWIDTLHACGPIHPPCTSVYTAATAESCVTACHTCSLLQGKALNTQPNLFLSQKHVSEKDVMTQRQVSFRSGRADIYRVKTARLLKAM